MSSKLEKDKQKQIQEKCQAVLSQLLRDEDNKYCVDCDAKGPRWASWNLGIFLCIRCAGIHRNLGVHISKVKSVNLDAWTPEQVACLQQMGNSRARAVYEANLPDNFRRPQTDSSLEAFIRAKYEQKKYIAKEWVAPPMPKPSIEFEDKKKPKEKKAGKLAGLEVPLPSGGVTHKTTAASSVSSVSSSKKVEAKEKITSGGSIDLLGLNEPPSSTVTEAPTTPSDDPFGRFLSADTSANVVDLTTATQNHSENSKLSNGQSNSDLEGIASQFGTDDLQKKQQPLSKESILSLYGQGPPIPQQPPVIGMSGAIFSGQQPSMFGCPNIPVMGGIPTMPVMGSGHMMTGMAISNVTPAVPQTHLTGTNPFFSSGSCGSVGGWFSATNPGPQPATFNQVHQQMAALNIGGPTFGSAPPHAQNSGWTGQQTGQTLSTNLWQ